MNNLNKIAIAVSVMCCSTAASLHAQTTAYNPSWYFAPSINALDPDSRFGVDKNGAGLGLRLGKPLSDYWDLQLGTTYARSRNGGSRYQQNTLGADMLYMFSREALRPFILVGAGYQRDKLSGPRNLVGSSPYISGGAGLQLSLNDQWSLQADYRRVYGFLRSDAFRFDRSNNNYVTVGLNYAFDKPAAPYVRTAMEPEPARVVVAEAPPAPLPAPTPAAPLPPPAPRFEKFTLSATELFAFDRDKLQMPQPKLDEIASALNRYTDVTNVVITGYADNIGSDKYNQKLSERRAVAVKDYLVSKGVSGNRMRAEGRGEANPVVTCTNKNRPALIKCLEPNRRVEIEQITIERRV